MAEPAEWLTVPRVAKLLGLQLHTVYDLIYRDELAVEEIVPPGPKRRRQLRVPRSAVDDFLARARVKPGELRHLHRP